MSTGKRLEFTSRVLGPKAVVRLEDHEVTQTLRSAKEVRNLGLPVGIVLDDETVEVTLDGHVIGHTDSISMVSVGWSELDIGDARRGGFDSLDDLENALKRAGFRYKDIGDYGFYRIQFIWG